MKHVQDVIERLWDFIDKLDINTFGTWALVKAFIENDFTIDSLHVVFVPLALR